MGQHIGDLIVTGVAVLGTEASGTTHVRRGGKLVSSGALLGGLVVDAGGNAVISGHVGRNVVNDGNLVLSGRVDGKILGTGALVMAPRAEILGADLPVTPVAAG